MNQHDSIPLRAKNIAGPVGVPAPTRSPRRGVPPLADLPRGENASHPEFPLECLCSHLHEPFQLTFARMAQQHFLMREDVECVASRDGLTLRGETEEAIEAAVVLLKDLYGPKIRVGPPTVRYHHGLVLEQPWMGMRVRCAPEHLDAVNSDLLARGATIVACDIEPTHCVIQVRAPLAELLGYRAALEKLTAGTGLHAMWLSHYAPVDELPPDGEAA